MIYIFLAVLESNFMNFELYLVFNEMDTRCINYKLLISCAFDGRLNQNLNIKNRVWVNQIIIQRNNNNNNNNEEWQNALTAQEIENAILFILF